MFLGPCMPVEGPYCTRQQEFSSSPNTVILRPGNISLETFTHISLLLLFSPYRWVFSETGSTDGVWWSFPHPVCTHQPPDTLSSGPSPTKVSCMNPWGVSVEWRHCCLLRASEAWLWWTPNCSGPKTISQSQPWDHTDLLELYFCSFANEQCSLRH